MQNTLDWFLETSETPLGEHELSIVATQFITRPIMHAYTMSLTYEYSLCKMAARRERH